MHLATLAGGSGETPVVVDEKRGMAPVRDILPEAPATTMEVIAEIGGDRLATATAAAPAEAFRPTGDARFGPPYRHPRKIWGIGLNYVAHASDLTESVPEEPASFMKGDHTIIGPGDPIPLPRQSQRVTAEAELGLVIGSYCRDVAEEDALDHVWGVCTILDQTAEDILARNPRFLTRSKNFPGFLSFGPGIVPLGEALSRVGRLADIEVSTLMNGEVQRSNTVRNMRYQPEFLVSFHSQVMPLFPGDIIATGTPGAIPLAPGDVPGCRIPGIGELTNPVEQGS